MSNVAVAFTEPTVNIVSAMREGHSHDFDVMPLDVKYPNHAMAAHGKSIDEVRDWYART
ncbi:unannotated protein [freshwater metagenome]|uniref:Unannotated protein n=1 Tax=freshwater metagenome TaxID=449393 RepID=A0A6J6E687_9ZZZZ